MNFCESVNFDASDDFCDRRSHGDGVSVKDDTNGEGRREMFGHEAGISGEDSGRLTLKKGIIFPHHFSFPHRQNVVDE
jgi:hypothetical protein